MVSSTIDRLKLKEFDRQIGALFGLAKGGLYCILATLFGATLLGDRTRETINDSKSGRFIASLLARSESIIPTEAREILNPYLQHFDSEFSILEPDQLPINNRARPKPDPGQER